MSDSFARRLGCLAGALLLFALALPPAVPAAPAAAPRYSQVRVDLSAPGATERLRAEAGRFDIVGFKPGHSADIVATPADLAHLRALGLPLETVHEDLAAFYRSRLSDKGANFGLYHTYSEATQWLDDLHAQYPQVVSAKWSIGQSHEGRDIWCVRVSDNPEIDEPDEPEVEIDGLHHAREVMASEMVLMLIDYLGSHYGSDPDVTRIVNSREIYLVPIVNPDGFVYNETTNPNGGGMWRKNRRDNGDGTYGVDPNRNYPYEWGGSGSSPYTGDETYRGPAPGSEPEVQAIMGLVNAHAFVTSMSFHTYSDLTLYPWGYTTSPTPDNATYVHMSQVMTRENGYTYGQPGVLLYDVNGGSFDWVYGAQTEHPKCFAFTNEIGSSSDGFWPSEARRQPLFDENLWPSLYLMMAADAWVQVSDAVVTGGDGDAFLDPGETAGLALTLENLGVTADSGPVTITLSTDDPYLQLGEAQRTVGSVPAMGSLDLSTQPFPVTVDPACPADRALAVTVTVDDGSGAASRTFTFSAGPPTLVFSDDFESGAGAWNLSGTWALTTADSHSPGTSLTDSPGGDYVDQTDTAAELAAPVLLATGSSLTFWHRYAIEQGWDYGYVQISADGGPWTTLATYSGTQSAWQQVTLDLSAYAGSQARIRFELVTDYSVTYDGWYVDDVQITGGGSTNQLPPPPAQLSPAADAVVGPTPTLVVAASTDPEGYTPLTYGFRVYADTLGLNLVAGADGVTEGGGQAAWAVPSALPDGDYWWRAYAADDQAYGLLGAWRHFTVDSSTDVLGPAGGPALRRLAAPGVTGGRWRLVLPRAAALEAAVYDLRGRRVRRLRSGDAAAGEYLLTWQGRDDHGQAVASGVYLLRVKAGSTRLNSRVTVVR